MKNLIQTYTYDPVGKTVAMSWPSGSLSLEQVLLVTNVTRNQIIYNFSNQGGSISNNVLTFTAGTAGHSASDRLQIWIDDGYRGARDDTLVELENQTVLLRRLLKIMESSATIDGNQRQKVTIDSISPSQTLSTVTSVGTVTTVTSVTTVNAVSSLTAFGANAQLPSVNALSGVPTIENQIQWSRTLAATSLRPNLVFS